MSFPADMTVGAQRIVNVRVEGEDTGELYVPVRAVVTVDKGNLDRGGAPRFEWDVNALGMAGMRIGADSVEDLCRSATYMVSVHMCQARALILPGKDGSYGVQTFGDGHLIEIGPGIEATPEDKTDD